MKAKLLIFTLLITILLIGCKKDKDKQNDNLIVYGKIYTAEIDPTKTDDSRYILAEAMVIRDGKYIYVGDKAGAEQYVNDNAVVIDYTDRGLILPGMTEGHAHHILEAQLNAINAIAFVPEETPETFFRKIKERVDLARQTGEQYVFGFGWLYQSLENDMPTLQQLDSVAPDIPIYLADAEFHKGFANSKTLINAGIMDENGNVLISEIRGGEIGFDENGKPSGFLSEQAGIFAFWNGVKANLSSSQNYTALMNTQIKMHRVGYTNIVEGWSNYFGNGLYDAAKSMSRSGELQLCLTTAYEIESWQSNYDECINKAAALLQLKDSHFSPSFIKLFIDGTVETKTGYTMQPYLDSSVVTPIWNPDELTDIVQKANAKGITLHIHTMGDAAIHQCMDAYETVKGNGMRNQLVHVRNVAPEDYSRIAECNTSIASGASWHWAHPFVIEHLSTILPMDYATHFYPINSYFNNDINAAFSSDAPATSGSPYDPFGIMEIAVNGNLDNQNPTPFWPEECVSRYQALQALTINGAHHTYSENERGSIKVGKYADFVLADKDVLTCESKDIHNTQVNATYFEGVKVYQK